jgi:hypothetical protein
VSAGELPTASLLADSDLELLLKASGGRAASVAELRRDPGLVGALLERPSLFDAVFGVPGRDPLLLASPLLVFSVLVHQAARDLEEVAFVREWLGPGQTVPVFDAAGLREFLASARRRDFLARLLASYTRVASGSFWVRTARGWRRRRYSELEPVRLAELLEVVPETERPAVRRRLGDLCLFLAGVFPEYATSRPLPPRQLERAVRLLEGGLTASGAGLGELARAGSGQGPLWTLEWLGRRAYALAAVGLGQGTREAVLDEVVEGFGRARRVLNLVTARYLRPSRDRWFPLGG